MLKTGVRCQVSGVRAALAGLLLFAAYCLLPTGFLFCQQAQTNDLQTTALQQSFTPTNVKYVQGVGIGYWPTAGSGLVLNLAGGTAVCNNTVYTYAGGTLTLTANATNYVYLNASASCVPGFNTTGWTSTTRPIATVVASSSAITSITDVRTMFWYNSVTGTGGPVIQINGVNVSNQGVFNCVNGTYLTCSSPGSGQIKFDITSLPNIGIAGGGTGQTTATAAFNALTPMTTEGDLEYLHSTSSAYLPSGMTVWLEADAITGLGSGLPLSSWTDQSGNANNATQSNSGYQPVFQTNVLNGLPGVLFNGGDYLATNAFALNQPSTVCVVGSSTASGWGSFADSLGGATRWMFSSGLQAFEIWGGADLSQAVSNMASPAVMCGVFNGASSLSSYNGTTATGDAGSSGGSGLRLGGFSGSFLTGYEFEVLVFNSALSDAARQGAEGYLAWKWGLQGSLASGHPYKSFPPGHNVSAARLPIGASGQCLNSNGADPQWGFCTGSGITFQANGVNLTSQTPINFINSTYLTVTNPSAGQYQISLTSLPTQPISAGGTGQTSAAASFNALSPMATEGDLVYYHASSGNRLAVGGSTQVLCSNGTDPYWCTPGTGGFGTQFANMVFAGPASGPAALPTFRGLTPGDLPSNITSNTSGTAASLATAPTQCTGSAFAQGIAASGNANCIGIQAANSIYAAPYSSGGVPSFRTLGPADIPAGTLAASQFGNFAQNSFLAGPYSGGPGTPTVRTIGMGDLPVLSGVTGSIGGSALSVNTCASGTVSIPGASNAVSAGAAITATPRTYPGSGFTWSQHYLSATDTVTVSVCATVAGTPTASVYNVRVF